MNRVTIKEAVETMSNLVNSFGLETDKFTELMGREHRTLQQNFTRLCVAWFEYLSKVEHCDLRNEASVKLGKAFIEKLQDEMYLPHI
jgi:hypothetical protein